RKRGADRPGCSCPACGRGGELGRGRRLRRRLPHLRLLCRGDGAGYRAHVAALAAKGDCAAAGLADRHIAISGPAARTSVTVVQQKTRRRRPAGLSSDVLATLDLLEGLGFDHGPELFHLAL